MAMRIDGTTIYLTRGDTAYINISILDSSGEAYVPGEGDEVRFAVKRNLLNAAGTEYKDANPLIVISIPTSTMLLTIEPEDTKPLGFGRYAWDLQLTKSGGVIDTFLNGILELTPEVD